MPEDPEAVMELDNIRQKRCYHLERLRGMIIRVDRVGVMHDRTGPQVGEVRRKIWRTKLHHQNLALVDVHLGIVDPYKTYRMACQLTYVELLNYYN
jgi:hypothetical protein